MSEFSGKCDFYDGFVDIHCDGDKSKITEELSKLKLYIRGKDDRKHLVKSDTIMDIAKYYPYLRSLTIAENCSTSIVLASDSFIDQEEAEWLNWKVEYVLKYWRKCKRNKKPFVAEECLNELSWLGSKSTQLKEIICRVEKDGNKAEFDDIHDDTHEHFRRKWFEEMVRVGWTEREAYDWCFKGIFDPEKEIIKRLGRPLKTEE